MGQMDDEEKKSYYRYDTTTADPSQLEYLDHKNKRRDKKEADGAFWMVN